MSRAPFVMGKSEAAFQRSAETFDTTIGGASSIPHEKVHAVHRCRRRLRTSPTTYQISRADQDAFALRSQQRAAAAAARGAFDAEILAVEIQGSQGSDHAGRQGRHPRPETTLEALSKLRGIVRPEGSANGRATRRASTMAPQR